MREEHEYTVTDVALVMYVLMYESRLPSMYAENVYETNLTSSSSSSSSERRPMLAHSPTSLGRLTDSMNSETDTTTHSFIRYDTNYNEQQQPETANRSNNTNTKVET